MGHLEMKSNHIKVNLDIKRERGVIEAKVRAFLNRRWLPMSPMVSIHCIFSIILNLTFLRGFREKNFKIHLRIPDFPSWFIDILTGWCERKQQEGHKKGWRWHEPRKSLESDDVQHESAEGEREISKYLFVKSARKSRFRSSNIWMDSTWIHLNSFWYIRKEKREKRMVWKDKNYCTAFSMGQRIEKRKKMEEEVGVDWKQEDDDDEGSAWRIRVESQEGRILLQAWSSSSWSSGREGEFIAIDLIQFTSRLNHFQHSHSGEEGFSSSRSDSELQAKYSSKILLILPHLLSIHSSSDFIFISCLNSFPLPKLFISIWYKIELWNVLLWRNEKEKNPQLVFDWFCLEFFSLSLFFLINWSFDTDSCSFLLFFSWSCLDFTGRKRG